jgi:LysM repeat protein
MSSIKLDWEVSDAPEDPGQANRTTRAQAPISIGAGSPPAAAPSTPPTVNPQAPLPAAPPRVIGPAEAAPPARQPRRWWSWPLLALVVLAAAGLSATWYISRQGWNHIQDDIRALVRYEEEQAYAGQVNLALVVQDPDNRDWLSVRRDQLEASLPAPAPVPQLQLSTHAFAVDAVTALDGDFVQAQVRREYATPDGQSLPFTLAQFYRRRGADDWQRTAPPGLFWGNWVDWQGDYLLVRHSERDAAFVQAVAPQLDAWLAQACAVWQSQCADVLPAKLYLSSFIGSLEYDPLSNVEVRVEFGEGASPLPADYFLSVPSPQIAGAPTTPAGQDYLAEYLAVRLIASLADRATDSPFEYATLTAQAIKQLGLGRADPGYASLPVPQAVDLPTAVPTFASRPIVVPTPPATKAGPTSFTYTVQPGDTLSGIAELYSVTVEALMDANGLTDPDVLQVGQVINIPFS